MSGTTDPVQGTINAQSGRFEFFKQALTLGLAGIGGIAAILADTTKIPSDLLTRLLVSASGILALLTAGFALLGISTYANLLKATATPQDATKIDGFANGVVGHAQKAYVFLFLTGLAFLGFAAVRLWASAPRVSMEAELGLARDAIASAAGIGSQPIQLDRYEAGEKDIVINYSVGPQAQKYVVTIDRSTGTLKSMTRLGAKTP